MQSSICAQGQANATRYMSARCAQAAALYIAGFERDARLVMAKFKWGNSFFQLNGEYLDRYAECKDSAGVIRVQKEIIAMIEEEQRTREIAKAANVENDYGGNFGIVSSESDEEYYDETAEDQHPPSVVGPPQPSIVDETGSFGLGQLAEAQAQRLARLGQLAQPPPVAADVSGGDLQDAIDNDFGLELEPEPEPCVGVPASTTSADSTDSADPSWDIAGKMLTPALLHSGDANSEIAYPAPKAPQSTYSPPDSGDIVDVPINTCRPGLVFDDSWMEDTPEGGYAVIGEFKHEDEVLEKIAEREREAEQATCGAPTGPVLDEI
eukprot:COSAG02_NODE_955_length_15680_cov_31.906681_10_plen_323_part_00